MSSARHIPTLIPTSFAESSRPTFERLPPTLVLHGKADTTVPYATAEAFTAAMRKAGSRCELVGYEGQPHGFFNHNREAGRYKETVAEMDRFLISLGFIPKPKPQPR